MNDDELMHYGILRRSGRYPWGSGDNPHQRSRSFLDHVKALEKEGLSQVEIAKGLGLESTTQLRAMKAIAKNEVKKANEVQAMRLKEKGYSNSAIAEKMGLAGESSVRQLLDPSNQEKTDILIATSNMLREQVDGKGYIDIGAGVENSLGISQTKLNTAIAALKEEGYEVHNVQVAQLGTGGNQKTTIKVLAPPGTKYVDIVKNPEKIRNIDEYSDDGGRTFLGIKEPISVNPNRMVVRYGPDGGADMDGVIELRRGVKDLDMGSSNYAQVRIAVGKDKYLKGMAIYSDDLPDGVDIRFNTNKPNETGNKLDVLKQQKPDKDNPFGASITRQKGALNIVNEEGDWHSWSHNLSSQMLSKQSPKLAKQQLDLAYNIKKSDYDDIMALTNPTVKKKLLETFADNADSAASKLQAAGLHRTRNHVLLPINNLKENEIYAPNYRNGERVVLIRHPHGGTFEIPELTVNNRNKKARSVIGQAIDAVGINSKVANRLSGADFDGDTVLVIPNNNKTVKTSSALKGLKDFDPKSEYPSYKGMKPMRDTQKQMGVVSNLITDMTVKGASQDEIARAVRHSMVVIDAEKHNLDYLRSFKENGIAELKKRYQYDEKTGGSGASTLISRASAQTRVPVRKPRPYSMGGPVDKKTGKKVYIEKGETYTKNGKVIQRTEKVKRMDLTDDAFSLSSGTRMESIYASHANRLKSLANDARKTSISLKGVNYSPSARKTHASEVASLTAKLNTARKNKPRERKAQLLANAIVKMKRDANPDMDSDTLKKVKTQALNEARVRTGANKSIIKITPVEWNAIQAGAISNNMLRSILDNADIDDIRTLATPKNRPKLGAAKIQKARNMINAGYTQAEIADVLGVSTSTLNIALGEGGE